MPLTAARSYTVEPATDEVLVEVATGELACEYQPIITAHEEQVWGYEALTRFYVGNRSYAPDTVFRALHQERERFFELESRAKRFQLEHRPKNTRLFVNLDPDVCEQPHEVSHWVHELAGADDVTVEIIENTTVTNLDNIRRFTRTLNKSGVHVALDDIGGTKNLFSFDLLEDVDYLKLDRRWFVRLDSDPSYRALIEGLVAFSRARGIKTVLEGVETRRHLSVARSLNVDLVQGFLFRDGFIHS